MANRCSRSEKLRLKVRACVKESEKKKHPVKMRVPPESRHPHRPKKENSGQDRSVGRKSDSKFSKSCWALDHCARTTEARDQRIVEESHGPPKYAKFTDQGKGTG